MNTVRSANVPLGLRWRSSNVFILSTVTIGLFTDLFLYGLIIPIVPFILQERVGIDGSELQAYTSLLLAVFAGASFLFSPIAGWICDNMSQRRQLFLVGLLLLLISTVLTALGQFTGVLIISRILGGASGAVVWTVGITLVMETVGPGKMGTTMGTIFSFTLVSDLISPVLGGIVYSKLGSMATFSMGFALIALDFIMRLLVVEKKVALSFEVYEEEDPTGLEDEDLDEMASLLSKSDPLDKWKIPEDQSKIIQRFPILYCFKNARFVAAFTVYLVAASLYGVFDSALPTETIRLYNVDPLKAGLIFVPIVLPGMFLGRIFGKGLDEYGAKPFAVLGLVWMVPSLICLRIPQAGGLDELIKLCVILAFSGIGVVSFGSVPFVEITKVISLYHKANPDFFGEQGPYGQSYAFSSMVFSLGLTLGPILAGILKESIGFGNTMLVMASIFALCGLMSYRYVGDDSEWPKRKR